MASPFSPGMPYDSATHYPVVVQAAKDAGEMTLASIRSAFIKQGIEWPANFNEDRRPNIRQLDNDICRAWRECGYRN